MSDSSTPMPNLAMEIAQALCARYGKPREGTAEVAALIASHLEPLRLSGEKLMEAETEWRTTAAYFFTSGSHDVIEKRDAALAKWSAAWQAHAHQLKRLGGSDG